MDIKELSKPLEIHQIDFRIQSINKGKYATILAYKDARVDMQRLDEICSPYNWQRDHKEVKGVVYCGIGIRQWIESSNDFTTEDSWVWKWDAGTESNTEKQKGEASDSFKRAGFNWGIGRELYDYPLIQVKLLDSEVQGYQGKFKQSFGLKLKEWVWNVELDKNNQVILLSCVDQSGNSRFNYPPIQKKTKTKPTVEKEKREYTSDKAASGITNKVPLARMMINFKMTAADQLEYAKLLDNK